MVGGCASAATARAPRPLRRMRAVTGRARTHDHRTLRSDLHNCTGDGVTHAFMVGLGETNFPLFALAIALAISCTVVLLAAQTHAPDPRTRERPDDGRAWRGAGVGGRG